MPLQDYDNFIEFISEEIDPKYLADLDSKYLDTQPPPVTKMPPAVQTQTAPQHLQRRPGENIPTRSIAPPNVGFINPPVGLPLSNPNPPSQIKPQEPSHLSEVNRAADMSQNALTKPPNVVPKREESRAVNPTVNRSNISRKE